MLLNGIVFSLGRRNLESMLYNLRGPNNVSHAVD
jgi:hypothetical protein